MEQTAICASGVMRATEPDGLITFICYSSPLAVFYSGIYVSSSDNIAQVIGTE